MIRTHVYLTEQQAARLRRLAASTGKTRSALVREAIDRLGPVPPDRAVILDATFGGWPKAPDALRAARGLWSERDDLPDFAAIRREADDRLARLYGEDM